MKKKVLLLCILTILASVLLSGCIPGDGSYTSSKPAGFLSGIWHGWVAPISLIISIFKRSIRVYEVVNKGWWYDFGFYMAIIGGFGGVSFSRKRKKDK